MKKIFFIFAVVFAVQSGAAAQEMQLSLGPEFGLGVSRTKNTLGYIDKNNAFINNTFIIEEDTSTAFLNAGISFAYRVFAENPLQSDIDSGVAVRSSLAILTSYRAKGTTGINGYYESVRDTYKLGQDDWFMLLNDTSLGPVSKISMSNRFSFLYGFGLNFFNIMYGDDYENWHYLAMGIYAEAALQFSFNKNFYMELGTNLATSLFSNTTGTVKEEHSPFRTMEFNYGGRLDLSKVAFYLHIGRSWDLSQQLQKE